MIWRRERKKARKSGSLKEDSGYMTLLELCVAESGGRKRKFGSGANDVNIVSYRRSCSLFRVADKVFTI